MQIKFPQVSGKGMAKGAAGLVAAAMLMAATPSSAQDWNGFSVSAFVGGATQGDDADEVFEFDKDLDGRFTDTILTAAGANAFSPGFCGGAAATALPAGGCADDENGIEFGGRVGYDWQFGRFVVGVAGDLSTADINDSVSAFSTTPAFYTFTRELNWVAGARARAGWATPSLLLYGTAGPAWGDLEHSFTTSNTVNTFVRSDSSMTWGMQAGGGATVKLQGRWLVGGELLWSSLSDDDYLVRVQGPAPATNPFILTNAAGTDLRRSASFDYLSFRATIGVRF